MCRHNSLQSHEALLNGCARQALWCGGFGRGRPHGSQVHSTKLKLLNPKMYPSYHAFRSSLFLDCPIEKFGLPISRYLVDLSGKVKWNCSNVCHDAILLTEILFALSLIQSIHLKRLEEFVIDSLTQCENCWVRMLLNFAKTNWPIYRCLKTLIVHMLATLD